MIHGHHLQFHNGLFPIEWEALLELGVKTTARIHVPAKPMDYGRYVWYIGLHFQLEMSHLDIPSMGEGGWNSSGIAQLVCVCDAALQKSRN